MSECEKPANLPGCLFERVGLIGSDSGDHRQNFFLQPILSHKAAIGSCSDVEPRRNRQARCCQQCQRSAFSSYLFQCGSGIIQC